MSTEDARQLPYRQGVGVCLFNGDGLVLIAERRDRPKSWQMPQGGVQRGEILHLAALREMKEEIGTDNAEFIGVIEKKLSYEFPDWLQHKSGVFRGKYRGQEQTWYALRYLGKDEDIKLDNEDEPEAPEFSAWKWAKLTTVSSLIVPFKKPVYDAVVAAFTPLAEAIAAGKKLPLWKPPA